MKFNVIAPCAHCPFRKDVPGFLHPERAAELAAKLEGDDTSWFACHETTTSKGRSVRNQLVAQCAGQMILQQKLGRTNVAMRIAYALGMLRPEQLKMDAPVFGTFAEFVQHHTAAWGGRRRGGKIATPQSGRTEKPARRGRRRER